MSRHVRSPVPHVRPWAAAAALALCASVGHAQTTAPSPSVVAADAAFGRFMANVVGGNVTVASNGAALAQAAPVLTSKAGSVAIARSLDLKGPSGAAFKATASGVMNRAALGRVLAAGLRGSGYLAAGVALYEVAKAMGWIVSKDENGNTVYVRPDPSVCTQSPCYQYQGNPYVGITDTPDYNHWYPTAYDAAMSWVGPIVNGQECKDSSSYRSKLLSLSGTYATYEYRRCNDNSLVGSEGMTVGQTREVPPAAAGGVVSTADEFAADVAARGVDSPYLPQAVADALQVPAGSVVSVVDLDQITIAGPATTPVSTSTTTAPSGVTTTTKVYDKHTYSGPTVSTTRETEVQTYDPTTGQTTTTGTTTSSHTSETKTEVQDPCEIDPSRVGCMSAGEAPPGEPIRNKVHTFSVTPVPFASNAACPAPVSFSALGHTYAISWQPMCDAMGMIKALTLAISFFIAAWIVSDSFKVT